VAVDLGGGGVGWVREEWREMRDGERKTVWSRRSVKVQYMRVLTCLVMSGTFDFVFLAAAGRASDVIFVV